MKKLVNFFAAVGLLLTVPLSAQIAIGQYTLARMAAPPLRASIGAGGFTAGFLRGVGGVAFKETAHPVPGSSALSVELQYVPLLPDGQRVVAIIDGQRVRVNLYDWQLQPIARFANSDEHAVFTLFGQLADKGLEEQVIDNGGRVVNYHQAFVDTLLGLRMLQVDNLLADSEGHDLAVDLPREHNRYVLGPGEQSPDMASNRLALTRYQMAVAAGVDKDAASFRSYVVGDTGREIGFNAQNGALSLTGQPGYYFWRYNGDNPGVGQRLRNSTRSRIELAKNAARQSAPATFNEKSWLAGQIAAVATQIEGHPVTATRALELLDLTSAGVDKLNDALEDLRVERAMTEPAYRKIESLTTLSQFVNARLSLVRSINPVVWDAATTVMRYSAFFRYCKANNAAAWQAFLNRVDTIKVQPAVETPTVLQIASDGTKARGAQLGR
jgi:hypothetical protein